LASAPTAAARSRTGGVEAPSRRAASRSATSQQRGTEIVLNGGIESNGTITTGGLVAVSTWPGSGTVVSFGATLELFAGATYSGVTVSTGGILEAGSGYTQARHLRSGAVLEVAASAAASTQRSGYSREIVLTAHGRLLDRIRAAARDSSPRAASTSARRSAAAARRSRRRHGQRYPSSRGIQNVSAGGLAIDNDVQNGGVEKSSPAARQQRRDLGQRHPESVRRHRERHADSAHQRHAEHLDGTAGQQHRPIRGTQNVAAGTLASASFVGTGGVQDSERFGHPSPRSAAAEFRLLGRHGDQHDGLGLRRLRL